MSDDTINDLKQFITATFSQQTTELRNELRDEFRSELGGVKQEIGGIKQEVGGLKQEISGLRQEIGRVEDKLDGFIDFVTEAFDSNNDVTDEQFKNHERRIVKLEQVAHA